MTKTTSSQWESLSTTLCKEALMGCSNTLKRSYNRTYCTRQKKFHQSEFFAPLQVLSDADWLNNYHEKGQTFEAFWRNNLAGCYKSSNERPTRPQTAMGFQTKLNPETTQPKIICIQQIGKFPEATKISGHHPFIVWLKAYSSIFFQPAEVRILPELSVSEIKCQYRVNELTGKFQLNGSDILKYLKKKKPRDCRCLITITMIDLFPKTHWDFTFGIGSGTHGVGVFSFARFQDTFYETWTQGKDVLSRDEDGNLDYSPFTNDVDSNFEIKPNLLMRACKILSHEICQMLGMKYCAYYQCLMNGSNHLQEADRKPLVLCPICLRKLQALLEFDVLQRYKRLLAWASGPFWEKFTYQDFQVKEREANKQTAAIPLWKRRGSLPDFVKTKPSSVATTTLASAQKGKLTRRPVSSRPTSLSGRPVSGRPVTGRPASHRPPSRSNASVDGSKSVVSKTKKKVLLNEEVKEELSQGSTTHITNGHKVPTPPLGAFKEYSDWLQKAIEFLESNE